jgi:hypothetical protein
MSRIDPLSPPYPLEIQKLFDVVMPSGMDPLVLFRVMARSDRLFPRFMRAGVLDEGPVPIRDREIVIHRTTARCRAEYEWGVHVNAFGRPLGLGEDVLRATVSGDVDDSAFDARQAALVRLCDELHETHTISDACWAALRGHFDEMQILEYMKVVGGVTPEPAQTVDDGTVDMGKVVVGDDSSMFVGNDGTLFVSYQDATNGLLKLATNAGTGWEVRTLTVDGWVNGFTQVVDVGGSPQVMAHWRKADPTTIGGVTFVTP